MTEEKKVEGGNGEDKEQGIETKEIIITVSVRTGYVINVKNYPPNEIQARGIFDMAKDLVLNDIYSKRMDKIQQESEKKGKILIPGSSAFQQTKDFIAQKLGRKRLS